MHSKYRWKNGTPPTRDQAATQDHLLDGDQFESAEDQQLAENSVRKQLGVPLQTMGDEPVFSPENSSEAGRS